MTCVWRPDLGCLGDAWDNYDEDVQDRALLLATSSLQMLTYYRVGTCPITIRPCPAKPPCGCGWNPHVDAQGVWRNSCACQSVCQPLSEYKIPGPVGFIDELKIDGVSIDLDTGEWRLDDGHTLVWQGLGPSPLPETQDLNKPDTEVGTWSLTYSKSHAVSAEGRIAVAQLALEFANACVPKKKCALPRGVTSVVRSGVSFTIEAGLFPNGLTGIDSVDAYILKWAPIESPTRTATVFNPSAVSRNPRQTSGVPLRTGGGSL